VPLWLTRPFGDLREARAHLEETEAMARSMRNEVSKMVAVELTEVNTHLGMARNYRDTVVPSAESALKLARRQYESGSGNFLRLLEASRTLIAVQTEYYTQLYNYGEHWAQLERWVGSPLSLKERPHE
jgi:cobalt-zinc-cadmium efflux system outer membrane protein